MQPSGLLVSGGDGYFAVAFDLTGRLAPIYFSRVGEHMIDVRSGYRPFVGIRDRHIPALSIV